MTVMHPQLQRCYDLALRGAWSNPFFLIPLGHCEWHEATNPIIQTMAISSVIKDHKIEINLYINTDWCKGLPDDEVFGVLCHEILHAMLRHHERGGGKTPEYWGQATDMAINASLTDSQIKLPRDGLLPPRDNWEESADELYELIAANQIPKPKKYDPNKVGQGCMPMPGGEDPNNGPQQGQDPGQGDADGQGSGNAPGDQAGQGEGQGDRAWGEMIAQAQAMSRGTGSAKVLAKLFKPKPVKTQWQKLLNKVARRAQARGGRDNQTFSRVNRRSFGGDFVLPGWQSNRPAICAIIDSSGSVSDNMLRAALTSVKECMKISGVRIFLALHDGHCYFGDWISPETGVEGLSKLCGQRGGTDPREAFERVGKAKGRFDACVYLTDGEVGSYPDKPLNVKRMVVGIVGEYESSYRAQIPAGWQEILVEVGDE